MIDAKEIVGHERKYEYKKREEIIKGVMALRGTKNSPS